MSKVVLYLSRI